MALELRPAPAKASARRFGGSSGRLESNASIIKFLQRFDKHMGSNGVRKRLAGRYLLLLPLREA
jgi:hypothetical protein